MSNGLSDIFKQVSTNAAGEKPRNPGPGIWFKSFSGSGDTAPKSPEGATRAWGRFDWLSSQGLAVAVALSGSLSMGALILLGSGEPELSASEPTRLAPAWVEVRPMIIDGQRRLPTWGEFFEIHLIESRLSEISIRRDRSLADTEDVTRLLNEPLPDGKRFRVFLSDPGRETSPAERRN